MRIAGRRTRRSGGRDGIGHGRLTSLVFGIFEYGRLMMDWDLLNNAAREGCRYALANNTNPSINTEVQST